MKLLLLGAGYTGKRISRRLHRKCASLHGTTRHRNRFNELASAFIEPLVFNGEYVTPELEQIIADATHILSSIAPATTDPVLTSVDPALLRKNLQWLGYLSTIGVYGDHAGQWVDEQTSCKPVSTRSVNRLAAEKAWQAFADQTHTPLSIFRLSGIYGPGRNALVNVNQGKARRLIKPGQVFNRVHVDDIAHAVDAACCAGSNGVVNITDDQPAPPQDVVSFAASLLGVSPPPETDFDTADLSPMARSFYGENKRVRNLASKELPGFHYHYPTYRQGLQIMWDNHTWDKVD